MEHPFTRPSQKIRFGLFELDLQTGELSRDGRKTRLQEQPFKLLALLIEHPGQVITREEIRQRLWPADTFLDFDHSLNKAINKLREALGDSAEDQHFIETLPKRGYRFLFSIDSGPAFTRGTSIDSIAIFPLSTSFPDPDLEYLSVGIPGSIIHSLSHIPGLRVIAWNSVSRQDRGEDPLAIGRSVRAKVILIGRIWQRGTKLRLHVDLLDTANGEALWGEQYDRDLTELFAIHDDIAREVSARLRVKLTGDDASRITKRYTENMEAYQLYVRARRWCEKRSADGYKRGAEYLNRAIELDSNFALARAELAQVISVPCYYGAVDPNLAYPKARAFALRALELDPNLPEAHEVLATTLKNYDWNWDAAEKEFKLTIKLNPNYANGHYHYAYLLAEQGRHDEALHEITEALSREPMSPLLNAGLAYVLLHARQWDRCLQQALTALEVDSNMTLSYWTLGVAYQQIGKYPEAIEAYCNCEKAGGGLAFSKSFVIHTYARSGDHDMARELLMTLRQLAKTVYIPNIAFVIAYDGLGELDLALDALDIACSCRETNLVELKNWPHFDAIRHHPRFHEVERRVGLRK
jgi:DNA-binding winged helix-turn-helix (wHTH) protein/TolB-like protein/Tfp pilus assembly protein PilF